MKRFFWLVGRRGAEMAGKIVAEIGEEGMPIATFRARLAHFEKAWNVQVRIDGADVLPEGRGSSGFRRIDQRVFPAATPTA